MRTHVSSVISSMKLMWLLALLLVIRSGCVVFSQGADETRENLSLEEAQRLAPFAICLPTYIPAGIESTPRVTYHADFGDPVDSDVRLSYYQLSSQEPAFEVYQRYSPGASNANPDLEPNIPSNIREAYIRQLLAWLVGWSKVDETRAQATAQMQVNEEYWLFEIVEPASIHANMIVWFGNSVDYQIYSRLTAEEVKKVARSITDCAQERE